MISRSLSLRDPAIVQGMYIFKNPGIGRKGTKQSSVCYVTNDLDCQVARSPLIKMERFSTMNPSISLVFGFQ